MKAIFEKQTREIVKDFMDECDSLSQLRTWILSDLIKVRYDDHIEYDLVGHDIDSFYYWCDHCQMYVYYEACPSIDYREENSHLDHCPDCLNVIQQ